LKLEFLLSLCIPRLFLQEKLSPWAEPQSPSISLGSWQNDQEYRTPQGYRCTAERYEKETPPDSELADPEVGVSGAWDKLSPASVSLLVLAISP